jgi:hypothetical protein
MWKLVQRFRKLDRFSQILFLRSALLLPLLAISLRIAGFRTTQAMLERFLPIHKGSGHPNPGLAKDVARIARMVPAAAHYGLCPATCLEKSLALWWFLGRRGISSTVRIGTQKNGGGLEAHAWVEFDGMALNEAEEPRRQFAAFDAAFPLLSRE